MVSSSTKTKYNTEMDRRKSKKRKLSTMTTEDVSEKQEKPSAEIENEKKTCLVCYEDCDEIQTCSSCPTKSPICSSCMGKSLLIDSSRVSMRVVYKCLICRKPNNIHISRFDKLIKEGCTEVGNLDTNSPTSYIIHRKDNLFKLFKHTATLSIHSQPLSLPTSQNSVEEFMERLLRAALG